MCRTCVSPPELNDGELLAHLRGEAIPEVAAHLERCPFCRENARHLARLEEHLAAGLHRVLCPSPLELGEYHLGVLEDDRAEEVSQHLVGCPHCAREVARLEEYLADVAPDLEPAGVLERVEGRLRVLVAQLVGEGAGGGLQPSLVPALAVRGEEQGPAIYEAGDVQIAVQVDDDAENPGCRAILGLVTGVDTAGMAAHLWQEGQRAGVAPVDDLGNFCFSNLASDRFELILVGRETEVHIQDLELGAT